MFKRYWKNEDGATAVEFALLSLPFLLILFGIIESGRIVWAMNGVQYALEETSRYAALNPDLTTDDFQTYAETKLEDMYVSTDSLVVTYNTVPSNGVDFVEIGGTYNLAPVIEGFLPDDYGVFTLSTTVRKPVIE